MISGSSLQSQPGATDVVLLVRRDSNIRIWRYTSSVDLGFSSQQGDQIVMIRSLECLSWLTGS